MEAVRPTPWGRSACAMGAAWKADAAGERGAAARWVTFVVVGWSGEDGYGSQDGDEVGGEMHAGY